jgi:hypothetical protein
MPSLSQNLRDVPFLSVTLLTPEEEMLDIIKFLRVLRLGLWLEARLVYGRRVTCLHAGVRFRTQA